MCPNSYIRTSRLRILLFYAYLVSIGVLAYFVTTTVFSNRALAKKAEALAVQSHRIDCNLKIERQRRVDQSKDILARPDEPNNARILRNLGRPLIIRSLHSAQADLNAFKDVHSC